MKNTDIIAFAKDVIVQEHRAIEALEVFVDESFAQIAQMIFSSPGRLIVTGIGKSAIIAEKIVATLNSTGTPSIFMHAADAIHGDLGIIQSDDIVICISKSGNSPEIKVLIPFIKRMGNKVIGMVGNMGSFLAQHSDYTINTTVETEACPNNLAPTSSTTAQLVMGDALAMSLLKMHGFTSSDFARFHPGGALGKKLYTTVADIMSSDNPPAVEWNDRLDRIIIEISGKRLGAAAVLRDGAVVGVITDGDLRRMLLGRKELVSVTAQDIMSANPKQISPNAMAIEAHEIMEQNKITQLLVTKDDHTYVGIIHIHDLLREGVV
ncbi:MAG: KpsF/GutQ family sugar-phosphate isomerase [Rikenellaceae bacterium]